VTWEVPTPAAGVLKILVKEGMNVRVGAVVGQIDPNTPIPPTMNSNRGGGTAPPPAAPRVLVSAVLAIWYQPIFSGDSRLQVFGYAVVRMPLFRIPEFILGCLAGLFFTRSFENNNNNSPFMSFLMVRQNRDRFLLIGLLMIPAIICGHSLANMVLGPDYAIRSLPGFTLEAFFWYFAYMLPFSMVITGLSCGDNFLSPMLDHPMLVFLGEASYSLYIIHWIPLVALDLMQYEKGGWPGDLTILAIIAGIILLSGVCYKYVETPARKAIRSNLKKEKIALTT
jgi:peptidoglycan/LPS O-acetylase OafA/YrhL